MLRKLFNFYNTKAMREKCGEMQCIFLTSTLTRANPANFQATIVDRYQFVGKLLNSNTGGCFVQKLAFIATFYMQKYHFYTRLHTFYKTLAFDKLATVGMMFAGYLDCQLWYP